MINGFDFGEMEDRVETVLNACSTISPERAYNEYQYLKKHNNSNLPEVFIIDHLEVEIKMVYFQAVDKFNFEKE